MAAMRPSSTTTSASADASPVPSNTLALWNSSLVIKSDRTARGGRRTGPCRAGGWIHRGRVEERHHGDMPSAISYGPGVPDEHDLRLCGDVAGKRVIGLGGTANAIAFAERGARALAAATAQQIDEGRERAE